MNTKFSSEDYFKGIILYGLNAATYKMAFARCLFQFATQGKLTVEWEELADAFLKQYIERLEHTDLPQQNMKHRLAVMERIVKSYTLGSIDYDEAVRNVAAGGLNDVVPCFQTIGSDRNIVRGFFYDFVPKKSLVLKDSLLGFTEGQVNDFEKEITARWSLIEGAFAINRDHLSLGNDIRDVYLKGGYGRTNLTSNIPFLSGYQGNLCFYCSESMGNNIHVDHVLPRQVVCHDDMWNLVLAHGDCNLLKSDRLVGPHFVQKLIARNENIMGSNHPWRHKISADLGVTPQKRAASISIHYDSVKKVLGANYWGGSSSYNPHTDPFYRKLITVLNNRSFHIV